MHALRPFFQYLSLYLSIALIGGAIVHMPINPVRFGMIGLIGLSLFVVASFFEAKRKAAAGELSQSIAGYLGLSFALSLGLGMLSGSIQHFLDVPQYATILIPLGFVMAFVSYGVREKTLKLREHTVFLVILLILAGSTYAGLHELSHHLDGHGHHGHAH